MFVQKLCFSFALIVAACVSGATDLMSQTRKASDMAASSVFPASMISSAYQQGSAAGEPYLIKCTANANKIIMFLHTWSQDYQSVNSTFPELASLERACIVSPNFGGPNVTPQALGSDDSLARIDIVLQEVQYKTGLSRIYLAAASGGTLAALNYMSKYPGKIHRASLWLIIHDLASLYNTTQDQQLKNDMLTVIGHAPTGPDDPDYLFRSPRSRLTTIKGPTTIYLNAGQNDISTPPEQTTNALNQILGLGVTDLTVIHKAWPIGHVFGAAERLDAIKQLILE